MVLTTTVAHQIVVSVVPRYWHFNSGLIVGASPAVLLRCLSSELMLEAVMESTGEVLWQVIRSLEESAMLLSNMGQHLAQAGDADRAEVFFAKARQLEQRSNAFHADVLNHESLSGDNLGQKPEK